MARKNSPPVIVLAHRAPVRHDNGPRGEVTVTRSASGLVTALEPLVQHCRGTWVAHAAGFADIAASTRGSVRVGDGDNAYRVRYVAVPEQEHRGHYLGFSNEGLWPLCHRAGVDPVFRDADFDRYRAANARFAASVHEEAGGATPVVLVQDYHFALVPRRLRRSRPSATILSFWHIPWPRPGVWNSCPWSQELLDGLLGSDIVGVQTEEDRLNFLGCAATLPHARVDLMESTVTFANHVTRVRAYPVGVEWDSAMVRSTPPAAVCRDEIRGEFDLGSDVTIGVGIDRMDYSKGINHKFLAIEQLLDTRPELLGRFAFIQVAEPSRDCLPNYRAARQQARETADRINHRFAGMEPIRFVERHHDQAEVYRLYRAADFCYVGSLEDGMNLVAKEFVAAREDERGVLLLSEFAGATHQLRAAIRINPHRIEHTAMALAQAIDMEPVEQRMRMRVLRDNVEAFDAKWWAAQLLEDAAAVRADRHAYRPAAAQ